MNVKGVGIDVEAVERFMPFNKDRENHFLHTTFSGAEIDYCFSFKNPAVHLAGIFSAKEAVFKALGKRNILQSMIEIKKSKDGQPIVWIGGHQKKTILVSISHTKDTAVAIAIKNE